MKKSIHLRSETKAFERRTPLTPNNAKKLIDKGVEVYVEKFEDRIFNISEYEKVGCKIVESDSWKEADSKTYILGLKELEEDNFDLKHKHIYFAHVYKGQDGARDTLTRYKRGNGKLFDLEYLTNADGRRIAAFGYWAGFVGAAIGIKAFIHRSNNDFSNDFPAIHSYENKSLLINEIKQEMSGISSNPTSLIIGAKGRCGSGANALLSELGLSATLWDMEETKVGGPFKEISEHNLLVNTVLVTKKIPPFVDSSILDKNSKLSIIADVSCDPTSDLNPIPLYDDITSWEKPLYKSTISDKNIEILAVDNLPSLLPRESSEDFSDQLFPHLENLLLGNGEDDVVWSNSYNVFTNALKEL